MNVPTEGEWERVMQEHVGLIRDVATLMAWKDQQQLQHQQNREDAAALRESIAEDRHETKSIHTIVWVAVGTNVVTLLVALVAALLHFTRVF